MYEKIMYVYLYGQGLMSPKKEYIQMSFLIKNDKNFVTIIANQETPVGYINVVTNNRTNS